MEIRCDDPGCLRVFHLMSYHVEASSRLDGKITLTVTCPSCGQRMSSTFGLIKEDPQKNQNKGKEVDRAPNE